MVKEQRGLRDGSGPYKGSWQSMNVGRGRRQEAGEECPFDKEIKLKKVSKIKWSNNCKEVK